MVEETGMPDVAEMAHRLYKEARDHSSAWRVEARDAYDMVAGKQWSDEDRMVMEDVQNRIPVVFNRIARTLNAIIGTQVANRQETRFIPREQGDVQVNEVLTAAAEWVRDEADAEDEESDAFEDMCVTGMGWTETRMDYETEPDGIIRIDRVDPMEMFWDPTATKRNLSDLRWVMRIKRMTEEEFSARWPDVDLESASAPWDDAEDETVQRNHVYAQDAYKSQQALKGGPRGKRTIRVVHMQWAERDPHYRVGKKAERIRAGDFEKIRDKLDRSKIRYVKQAGLRWRQAFVAGMAELEQGDCPYPNGPTFRCMTYKRDRNGNTWFGIVRAMRDPQKFGNKFFSLILDIINKGAKGGVMIEADATDDVRRLEETWARPDAVHVFRPGALSGNKVVPKTHAGWPAGLDRLLTFSLDAVHEVTGINLELLGFANREQAGVLETQRKQAGLTILAPLFDALRRYRKEQGRVMLRFIQEYLSDGRLIRVVGTQGNPRYVPLAKQPDTARYDVIVDESPTSPNMKERVYGALVEILPALAKFGIPMPPELLDYAPIPSGLAQKWKETIETQSGMDPEQIKGQMDQLTGEIEKLRKENAALKDKREQAAMELQIKAAESQSNMDLKRQEMAMEMQIAKEEHDAKLQQMEREYQLKMAELQHRLQLAEVESQANAALNERKAADQAAIGMKAAETKAAKPAGNGKR